MKTNPKGLIPKTLYPLRDPEKAKILSRFFKTAPGEYGEGDTFLGIPMPKLRSVLKSQIRFWETEELLEFLESPWHEARMVGLLGIVEKYKKSKSDLEKERWVQFYLENRKSINNWDLVDVTVPSILGDYYLNRDKKLLFKFAQSQDLWENRIAILSTFGFLRHGQYQECLEISTILLSHPHDLIHKAVGWMLREIGKRDKKVLLAFLKEHSSRMPRTMLRYAIERLPESERLLWLQKPRETNPSSSKKREKKS